MVFSLSALWWRIKGLWKLPDGRNWWGVGGWLGLILMGGTMLSRSLIQFSVYGWSCVPSLLFIWGQTTVEVMKTTVTSFKRSHACTSTFRAPSPAAGHHWLMAPLETPRQSVTGKSGSVSCGVTAAFSWVLVHTRFCLCSPRVYFPVLCKFWQLHGGVNGDLLQEGLCHTQACCTQSPHPRGSPLLTCTSTRDAQTQFCLSVCGILRACSLEQPKLKTENAKCWQGCQATVTIKHCLWGCKNDTAILEKSVAAS